MLYPFETDEVRLLKVMKKATRRKERKGVKIVNKKLIIIGFIVLFLGGLTYTYLPYTNVIETEMVDGVAPGTYTLTTTTTGNNPLGAVVMFIGFTIVVVGLFYKPEEKKILEVKKE